MTKSLDCEKSDPQLIPQVCVRHFEPSAENFDHFTGKCLQMRLVTNPVSLCVNSPLTLDRGRPNQDSLPIQEPIRVDSHENRHH